MTSLDYDASYFSVEKTAEDNSAAAADAAWLSLSQHRPFQALEKVRESVLWYSAAIAARIYMKPEDVDSLKEANGAAQDTGKPLPRAKLVHIQEELARKDAIVNDSEPEEECELEQYSTSMTQALHTVFYGSTVFPCTCPEKSEPFCLLDQYACALRLDGNWKVSGNDSHCFFDAVVAVDESYRWSYLQFQLPRVVKQVHFDGSTDGISEPTQEILEDFCQVVSWQRPNYRIPIRIEGSIPDEKLYETQPRLSNINHGIPKHIEGATPSPKLYELDPVFTDHFPDDRAPMPLSRALSQRALSAPNRIGLAFALAKSFYQYYKSDWMRATWDFDTIHLLLQRDDCHTDATPKANMEMSFLAVTLPLSDRLSSSEYQPRDPFSKQLRMHRYPYILQLALLLVLLGTRTGSSTRPLASLDDIYCWCSGITKRKHSTWPDIGLREEHKPKYRSIVEHCLPDPRKDICLNIDERRDMLRDKVVRPLYEMLQGMKNPKMNWDLVELRDTETEVGGLQVNIQAGGQSENSIETPSAESGAWIDEINKSDLQQHIFQCLKDNKNKKRPKIAIIDTGYDGGAQWITHAYKSRLCTDNEEGRISKNWIDYWTKKDGPNDDFGHGTSMLYTVLRIAPFADVYVARIAGNSADLQKNPSLTSKHLADAIRWAADQGADVISMSLGWRKEHDFEKRPVVRNAITYALEKRDQKVLLFAAASNYGGGRYELFPASSSLVFSIRATNAQGIYEHSNPPLPDGLGSVIGTLGARVPTKVRTHEEISKSGASVATAVAAGLAAIVIGYINIHGDDQSWDILRTHDGFEKLLLNSRLSTEPVSRQRFFSLQEIYGKGWQSTFEACLNAVS